MNVFVLCTGRTASVAFAKACQYIDNFSAAHESRVQFTGTARLDFPEQHIEVDNRLCWFLGRLGQRFGKDAFYVHLHRDRLATARSFSNRWKMKGSIINAYAEAILLHNQDRSEAVCLDYVDTVNANVAYFLRDKPNQMTIATEDIRSGFREFWAAIGAKGDLDAALKEFDIRHNPTSEENWLTRIGNLFR